MSRIPELTLKSSNLYPGKLNRTGSMCNAYSPLQNLQDSETSTLGDFTTNLLDFDMAHPVDIVLLDSYDGSVNMILNDGKNQPRLVGSRFSVIDDGQFKIPDHTGFKDTNIYDENTFAIDTSIKTIALKIPIITFDGITQFGGVLSCGAYTFYFKLADADGNESEVVAESGIVQISIGDGTPQTTRMGLENENTGKSVTFTITNIDSGFDYVHVLYAKSSSSEEQAQIDTYHKIIYNYPIFDGKATINITGKEIILDTSAEEIYVDYADLQSVKTLTVVNNVLLFGNLVKKEHDWDALRIASWKILPSIGSKANVGAIDYKYNLLGDSKEEKGGYYNPYNVYYRVGYWPEELYRFGVVYIFNDNSLSPVFNIQGVDFTKVDTLSISQLFQRLSGDSGTAEYALWEVEPDDYYFNSELKLNSRGVIKFPKKANYDLLGGILLPKPLYIEFDYSNIGTVNLSSSASSDNLTADEFFRKHGIKGIFFVRQVRVPTIIAQGIAIGLTNKDLGALPVIKHNSRYSVQSFLDSNLLLLPTGRELTIDFANVKNRALLIPDAELSSPVFEDLFVSNEYSLQQIGQMSLRDGESSISYQYSDSVRSINDKYLKRKLTTVLDDVKVLTDGEVYFSTIAGSKDEPYKTSDVNLVWNESLPLKLTLSTSLVRGNWGPFVGVGEPKNNEAELFYGGVYNIKKSNYADDEEKATLLDFLQRFNAAESYRAICDRQEIANIENSKVMCYRGDCFISLFTHRMQRNFIDPELPTNHKIIDPTCWCKNYAVRNTAVANGDAEFNVYPENQGWYIDPSSENEKLKYANELALAFEVKEDPDPNLGTVSWDPDLLEWVDKYKNPIYTVPGGSDSMDAYVTSNDAAKKIQKIDPKDQEMNSAGSIIKSIFKSSKWTLRGLANIHRADVNAVALGLWIIFPICSGKNIALRDIDYRNSTEQAAFNEKRSFYPLKEMSPESPLADSQVINHAASLSVPHRLYYAIPNTPFLKLEYFTRIINSYRDSAVTATNEFKIFLETAYKDYTKIYGPITKILPLGSKLLVVFHHGIGVVDMNTTMLSATDSTLYLPKELNAVITLTYGSMWKDSVIEASGYIYGVDTVAKVIWRVNSSAGFEILSQLRTEKFLIDSIDMSEFVTRPYVGRVNVKSHYNAFKHDIMFTYYNDILYLFDQTGYVDTTMGSGTSKKLSDWNIDSEGYLINEDGTRSEYQGVKVVAEYNESTGKVDDYVSKIKAEWDNNKYPFKWANGKSWSLCLNELTGKFTTFYDWIPLESENIDNIPFSFDREAANRLADLGFSRSYPTGTSPTIEGISYRDEKYAKNLIDKTFNTKTAITYIDTNKSAIFLFSASSNELKVIGFYLKPGTTYSVVVYRKTENAVKSRVYLTIDLSSVNGNDYWQFIVVKVYRPEALSSLGIGISNIGDTTGAVTDAIIRVSDNLDWITVVKSLPQRMQIELVEDSDLDDYYFVRDLGNSLKLWKHGSAGIYDNAEELKPTHWYGQLHEFNFEFIARKDHVHKVFNNLLIISNKAAPNKFEVEVVGEVYEWHNLKPVLKWIADHVEVPLDYKEWDSVNEKYIYYEDYLLAKYKYVLSNSYGTLLQAHSDFPKIFGMKKEEFFMKLPYMRVTNAVVPSLDPLVIGLKLGEKDEPDVYLTPELQSRGEAHSDNTVTTALVYDKQLNEFRVHTEQLGNDMWKYGRLRGNMQYLEDLWRVEVRPVAFKYAYIKEGEEDLQFTKIQETRPRDKYIKIKIRYSGEDLAVIRAVNTLFEYSYA